ncbi:MAG: hypothetical protein L0H25_06640 [Micrococcales bacterium]|nr:hypothetical protein [Micrococcales bacterium]
MPAHTPAGWPDGVPPARTPGWQDRAVLWLLDQCPPDYRAYPGWRKHPVALAWLAGHHLDAQVIAMRRAWREARVAIGPDVPAEALSEILGHIEAEGIRLIAASRSARLLHEALQGKVFAPRL